MEQRDYIQKQISQLGKVLLKMLNKLREDKSDATIVNFQEHKQALEDKLDIDLNALIIKDADNFISYLLIDKNLSKEDLNIFAEILLLFAKNYPEGETESAKVKTLLSGCLKVYEYLENVEATYSMDRHMKIEKIRRHLNL
jgi:hypothetical protein